MEKFERSNIHFAMLKFVLSAMPDKKISKSTDFSLRFLYADEDGYIAGTDGHRLHVYSAPGLLAQGLYAVECNTATTILLDKVTEDLSAYPTWGRALETTRLDQDTRLFSGDDERVAQILRALPDNQTLRIAFLSDAAKGDLKYFRLQQNGAVYLFGENTQALLMPLIIGGVTCP